MADSFDNLKASIAKVQSTKQAVAEAQSALDAANEKHRSAVSEAREHHETLQSLLKDIVPPSGRALHG